MANKAIRGITVEIGGDTTKLGKALEKSEKQSRSLQNELKDVEKLLKFDPTNTELLAQKQKILAEMISETSDKLEIMEKAEAQVIEQFERGEIGEDQLRAFQREIIKTKKDLGDMQAELSATNKAVDNLGDGTDDAGDDTDEYKDSVEKAKETLADFKDKASETFDTLKKGAVALGAAAVATGGYALKLSTDFDKAFNTLAARTGASTEEMDALNESMERVYANNFGESIEDVAESMATVKTNTKLSGEELENATERAILLRDTFEFDVNESTRSAKMLMDQYGMSAEEAYNLIVQGAQKGLNKNGDLLDTINEYGVHFSGLGLSAEDMFNMLVNGAENGTFSVDKLGDAVKEFGIRVKDGTADEAFKTLGFSVDETKLKFVRGGEGAKKALEDVTTALFNMKDPVEKNRLGVELFGTMWEDLGADGVKALMDVKGECDKASTALQDVNNLKFDDIGSAIGGLGRTLETDVIKPLGEELKPVVEEAIEYVQANAPQIKETLSDIVGKIGDLVRFFVDHGNTVVTTVVAIGTGMIAWNVGKSIKGVVDAVKAYKTANEGATISQAILNGVMNANPAILIATLIATLVAGIIAFIVTNDEARAKFVAAWEAIKRAAKVVLDAIVAFFKSAWEWIKNIWSAIPPFFSGLWSSIKQIFSVVGEWFSNIFRGAWNGIKSAWSSVKTWFSDLWSGIKNTFSNVGSWFGNIFRNAWSAVKRVFANWGSFFGGLWTTIKNKFSSIGTNIANAIGGAVRSGINGVISAIERTINKGVGLINGAISLINKIPGVSIGKIKEVSFPRLARGGIVNRPTFAEIGENGAEAIIPLENNTEWVRGVARELNAQLPDRSLTDNSALLSKLDGIYERLNRLQVVLNNGVLVGEILDDIDAGLAVKQLLNARGV